eukprot:2429786-Amphidinium_carterae.1
MSVIQTQDPKLNRSTNIVVKPLALSYMLCVVWSDATGVATTEDHNLRANATPRRPRESCKDGTGNNKRRNTKVKGILCKPPYSG